jgi:hypothetical protein
MRLLYEAYRRDGAGHFMWGALVIDKSKELRARLNIPEHNECTVSLVIGHRAQEFRRTIPREFKGVRWVE